ncbi:MAG: endonuclease/exonuclease/phosphatase family protein [Anaerolineaceae bacterium]|jgi:endonuclease/exonuclease/phosphatase family metal-dependent hydrolase
MPQLVLKVMTLNLGGGVKNFTGSPVASAWKTDAILSLISDIQPDVLGVQEVAQYIDADGTMHSMVDQINAGSSFGNCFYGETLSMKKHLQIKKDLMIKGLFNDWYDWSKGNGLFSRIPFARLSDGKKDGSPRNVPLFQPLSYEGTRDTDPRFAILTRLKQEPYPFLINLHLTTLVGERSKNAWQEVVDAAVIARQQQIAKVLGLMEEHVLLKGLPFILMGDFNAEPQEYTLRGMLEEEKQFVRLVPEKAIDTHVHAGSVDHIFFFPANRLIEYRCRVVNSETAHAVSDHLPVVADLIIE